MKEIEVLVSNTGPQNKISTIKVCGYIDTTNSSEVEHALLELLQSGRYDIIVDLGDVDYISSAGWGVFMNEIRGIRKRGGDLKLANMIPEVYEVFELFEFYHLLRAHDTIEAAIKKFGFEF
jgi:anti-sigma B factor antagonist